MIRKVDSVYTTKQVLEGAGVRLRRGFGFTEVPRFDPFLLFDDFSSPNILDFEKGFPWHPHRGIETVTYLLDGSVRHKDSIGNEGRIGAGDIQWMSAGSGIIHEEMPETNTGIAGFQLWVNMPKENKMNAPKYQDALRKTIPEISYQGHNTRIVTGEIENVTGPISHISTAPTYLDIQIEKKKTLKLPVQDGYTAFIYVIDGYVEVEGARYGKADIVLFEKTGDRIEIIGGEHGARILYVSGKPLGERIAWHGPIVMNTEEELRQAYAELREGTFLKK